LLVSTSAEIFYVWRTRRGSSVLSHHGPFLLMMTGIPGPARSRAPAPNFQKSERKVIHYTGQLLQSHRYTITLCPCTAHLLLSRNGRSLHLVQGIFSSLHLCFTRSGNIYQGECFWDCHHLQFPWDPFPNENTQTIKIGQLSKPTIFLCLLGVHCGIYKSSYNMSNIA
jgi:hypothetical protein